MVGRVENLAGTNLTDINVDGVTRSMAAPPQQATRTLQEMLGLGRNHPVGGSTSTDTSRRAQDICSRQATMCG
jgi:hypothetical protein